MVNRLIMHAILVVLAVLGGAQAGARASASELYAPHPGHYSKHNAGGSTSGGALTRKTKQAKKGSRVLVRDEGRLLDQWVLNPELSKACNQRVFRQKRDNFYVAVVDGRTYGAAVGGHGSLVDRAKMAENQVVYIFRGQGTTNCRVFHRTK